MIVTVLSIKSRTIRDNYREAMFIAITMCCIIPVWFGWVISGLMALEKNRDACLAFGLSITSIIVFLIMFMPKSRQLAAMGRDGMYIEDGEEKFSTISRVVSPSFFHLKPVKPVHTSSKHQASVINPFAGTLNQYLFWQRKNYKNFFNGKKSSLSAAPFRALFLCLTCRSYRTGCYSTDLCSSLLSMLLFCSTACQW